jgi:hypothetical protein
VPAGVASDGGSMMDGSTVLQKVLSLIFLTGSLAAFIWQVKALFMPVKEEVKESVEAYRCFDVRV